MKNNPIPAAESRWSSFNELGDRNQAIERAILTEVARNAAPSVKRVAQELGGKSPNILLDDEDLATNVGRGIFQMMSNSGQSCNAPTRMLVPQHRMDEVAAAIAAVAPKLTVGDPASGAMLGPVVNAAQFDKIQGLIARGLEEGATAVIGGTGRPDDLGSARLGYSTSGLISKR